MATDKRQKALIQVGAITLILNIFLAFGKMGVGIIFASPAVFSDGLHSITDGFTTVGVMLGIKFSDTKCDADHPYGHERIEFIVALIFSLILIFTGLYIAYSAMQGITQNIKPPNFFAVTISVTAASIIVKELMYRLTIRVAKKYDSAALKASAVDHRVDVFSSLAVLLGLSVALSGFYYAEYIAAFFIAGITIYEAVKLLIETSRQLIDTSAGEYIEDKIRERTMRMDNILEIENLKTRKFGSSLYVDIDIILENNLTFEKAHDISHQVHDMIENEFGAKHVQVHISPLENT